VSGGLAMEVGGRSGQGRDRSFWGTLPAGGRQAGGVERYIDHWRRGSTAERRVRSGFRVWSSARFAAATGYDGKAILVPRLALQRDGQRREKLMKSVGRADFGRIAVDSTARASLE
jgi:hypothetical protein